MRSTISFLLLLAACALCRHGAAAERRSRIAWDATTQVRLFAWGNYTRMIEARGELIAVTDGAGVRLVRSHDGGRTWSEPQTVVPNTSTHDMAVPDLMACRDGTLLLCYNPRAAHDNTDPQRLFGIRVRLSQDGGRTWSDEIFVHDAGCRFGDGCWEPSTVELPDGEIRLYFADEGPYTRSDEQRIAMCRSYDGGQTWSEADGVSFRPGFRDGMPVPVLLGERNEILVAIEDNGYDHHPHHFQPTLLRTKTKRANREIGARSKEREYPLRACMEATATAGAPYLRRAATGELLLSYQSNAGRRLPLQADGFKLDRVGVLRMQVAVGDSRGRDFTNISTPFDMPESPDEPSAASRRYFYGNWNSLCPTCDGGVWALTATNRFRPGANECWAVKGWLLHDFAPRRIAQGAAPVWNNDGSPDLLVAPTSDARLGVRTASDGQRLHLLVEVEGEAGRNSNAEIDFDRRLRIVIHPDGTVTSHTKKGAYGGGEVKCNLSKTERGYRAEIAIERTLLSRVKLRGKTPVQAALLIPDKGFIRREQVIQTDNDPRTWLRIEL